MTTYLIHREMSPLRHADKQTNIFLPDFSESVKTKKKKTLVKRIIELWELLRCILTKWAKKIKERKIPKQNLWILIDMKKTKTCSKTRKKQATMIHNCVANKFFCILFSFKKMTPMAILFRPLWQIMIIITPFPQKKCPPTPNSQWISFSFSSSKTDLKKRIIPYITYHSRSSLTSHIIHT